MTTKHTSAMPDNFDAARVAETLNTLAIGVNHAVSHGEALSNLEMHLIRDTMRDARDAIAALLEARKAPEGHVIDDRGVVLEICSDETSHTGFRTIVLGPREAAEAAKEKA